MKLFTEIATLVFMVSVLVTFTIAAMYLMRMMMKQKNDRLLQHLKRWACVLVISLLCMLYGQKATGTQPSGSLEVQQVLQDIPAYSGEASIEINGDEPFFTDDDLKTTDIHFSELDSLGRCGPAMGLITEDTLGEGERGSIGMIKPSGWHNERYDDLIEDRYLYNRCHLIAWSLCGINADERNLITGTRYLNIEGMLSWENMVHDYAADTGEDVLYRATPVFEGNNLVADGVLLEAMSVDDNGLGLSFCVYCYNVQPGIAIDYSDGSSSRAQ
ncbi:MAG: DNA/RNA non-specific endonuclease [Bulleidia sp.]|nr:DNA/RNA non-specific endonuclease [Bulleidia sp.]